MGVLWDPKLYNFFVVGLGPRRKGKGGKGERKREKRRRRKNPVPVKPNYFPLKSEHEG
jgi:hypothetical protein